MLSFPDTTPLIAPRTLGAALTSGVPRAYAVLFFSGNVKLGWFLIAVTMLAPDMGVAGLFGVMLAAVLAWFIGFDRGQLRNGYLLFNPLLASLTVGWLHRCYHFPENVHLSLLVGAAVGALFLAVAMNTAFVSLLGLSAHSLPAVVVAYVLYFLGFSLYGPAPLASITHDWLDLLFLPPFIRVTGETFGAMLFLPKALPGWLILGGLIATSRLTALLGVAGFVAGYSTMKMLGFVAEPEGVLWCGFNFLLCGISLGAGYYVPSRASLLLALMASCLCAPVAISIASALRYFDLPPSALPGNFMVLTMAYALRQRREAGSLQPTPAPGQGPEKNARLILINALRFPHLNTPALSLPFEGERVITQGFDGVQTHRGPWRFALDFEAKENDRPFRDAGTSLDDFYTFDTPVLAPCHGVVARVVASVKDNAPGQNNLDENWGNMVLIYADGGHYVLLAHLKQDSITVKEGQRVAVGDVVGKCGSSGRSPIPHLHMQIQDMVTLGAWTSAFCLKQFIERSADGKTRTYRTSGVPGLGVRVCSPVSQPRLGDPLKGWLPGEHRYRVTMENNSTSEETLCLDFDEMGRFRLRSRRHRAQLTAFVNEGVFYATDYAGSGRSLLALIAIGLARVPFTADADVIWHDSVSAVPFLPAPLRWLHDTLDPFVGPAVLPYSYRFVNDLSFTSIQCRLEQNNHVPVGASHDAPREVTCRLDEHSGISHLEVRFGNDRTLHAERVDYQPPARAL